MVNDPSPKQSVRAFQAALDAADASTVGQVLSRYCSSNLRWYGVHPFGELSGIEDVAGRFWQPFKTAWRHVQRRQDVFFGGRHGADGQEWVVSMGHLVGLRDAPWLGIPATGKLSALRYAEFYRVEAGRITAMSLFFDLIDVMRQAGFDPLPHQQGAAGLVPGPRYHDGLLFEDRPPQQGAQTLALVEAMVDDLSRLNASGSDDCPPQRLARFWHHDMAWYGPAGIGSTLTIERYQAQHQMPFRRGLTNKVFNGHMARFAEGDYAAFFGWPNLTHQPVGGFLGLPACERRVDMRVVDVYRREGERLAENWVLIDLPHWLDQQGVDVLARCRDWAQPTTS